MLSREGGLHPLYGFGVQGSERVEQLPEVTEQAGHGRTDPYFLR